MNHANFPSLFSLFWFRNRGFLETKKTLQLSSLPRSFIYDDALETTLRENLNNLLIHLFIKLCQKQQLKHQQMNKKITEQISTSRQLDNKHGQKNGWHTTTA